MKKQAAAWVVEVVDHAQIPGLAFYTPHLAFDVKVVYEANPKANHLGRTISQRVGLRRRNEPYRYATGRAHRRGRGSGHQIEEAKKGDGERHAEDSNANPS